MTVGLFHYKSHYGDYVIGRTWDGVLEGDNDVLIAKPLDLRFSDDRSTDLAGRRDGAAARLRR